MREDLDQWKYVSLMAKPGQTYDFKFEKRDDVCEFIVAISQACTLIPIRHKPGQRDHRFIGVTNRKFISVMLLKTKLRGIARIKNTTIHGLFARAIFLTIQQKLTENSFFEQKIKYETLHFLL